jgi:hypothetical protein
MTRASRLLALLASALAVTVVFCPEAAGQVVYPPAVVPKAAPTLDDSAIGALIAANRGKPPATGEQLTKALAKLGKFAQLSIPFSAVRLDSGIANPRVVIAPVVAGLGDVDVNRPNLTGRLFLAANMEPVEDGDPRVTSVEFISWNTQRRQFDFGVIENMGGDNEPEVRFVDGGRCFACHKNRGPILGAEPWSNSTHHSAIRALVANKYTLVASAPVGRVGAGLRDRIDGMALVAPEAATIETSIRLGANLRLNREGLQLMNRSPGGRKAFVAMLIAIAEGEALDPLDRKLKSAIDAWDDKSYLQFAADSVALANATNSSMLIDFAPYPRKLYEWDKPGPPRPIPTPPPSGFTSRAQARAFENKVQMVRLENQRAADVFGEKLLRIAKYDTQRAAGYVGLPSAAQPSNPRAFVPSTARATQRPSGMVNPTLLAGVIGLTDGDRRFLARSLRQAIDRVNKPQVTGTTLARAVFEGPRFADVLAGGTLPDRDEFKDRFAEGLHELLNTKYPFTQGFPISRKDYASGPKYDPKLAEERELAVVPTTACLRCHDVRPGGKPRMFEPIPALAFDPFDKTGREAWVRNAPENCKEAVLSRLQERLFDDADMPPSDAPEYDRFRVLDAAAFDELKTFLKTELAR